MTSVARPANAIGPNAILQVVPALGTLGGAALVRSVFEAAGLARYLETPPGRMVDEADVARLFGSVHANLAHPQARAVARDAGGRTADYILANRIPAVAHAVLQRLPPILAANALAWMIAQNAWTFAGSGTFSVRYGRRLKLSIAANPIAVGPELPNAPSGSGDSVVGPSCEWHCAVFERLFRSLGAPAARVHETACCASGDPACVFALTPFDLTRSSA